MQVKVMKVHIFGQKNVRKVLFIFKFQNRPRQSGATAVHCLNR